MKLFKDIIRLKMLQNSRLVFLKYVFIFSLLFLATSFLTTHQAYATSNNPPPPNIVTEANYQCAQTGYTVAQLAWLSQAGNSSAETEQVPTGTTSVNLQVNWVIYHCPNQTSNINASNFVVNSITSQNINVNANGLVGQQDLLNYSSNTWTQNNSSTFPVDIPATSTIITINATWQGINQFNVTTPYYEYVCIGATPNSPSGYYNRGSYSNFNGPPPCFTQSTVFTFTVIVSGSPTNSSCPTFPNYASQYVSMPYVGPYSLAHPSSSSQSASSPAPSTYTQYTPQKVQMQAAPNGYIQDISIGGSRIVPTEVTEYDGSPGSSASASGNITLDYLPYVQNYPYDINRPLVAYDSYYTQTTWTPTFSNDSCSNGASLSGITCTVTNQANSSPTCPAGLGYNGGNGNPYGCYLSTYNCPPGAAVPCNMYQGPATPSYYCPAGQQLINGTECTYNYIATANYNWSAGPASQDYTTANAVDGPQMPACFNRMFQIGISPATSPNPSQLSSGYEDPNQAQLQLYLIANFLPFPGGPQYSNVRLPSWVNTSVSSNARQLHKYANGLKSVVSNLFGCTVPSSMTFIENPSSTTPIINYNINGSSISEPYSYTCPITTNDDNLADFVAGDYAQFSTTIGYTSGSLNETSPGVFSTIPSSSGSYGPYYTRPVHTKPYLKVFGGNVAAGASTTAIGSVCSQNSSIYAWNQGNSPNFNGSGTTLAVLLSGVDSQFASDQGSSTRAGSGLTFSNYPHSTYGSNYCPPSSAPATSSGYYEKLNALYPQSTYGSNCLGNITTTGTANTCIYNYGSNTLNLSNLIIGPYNHVVLIGTGPVNIHSNIVYDIGSSPTNLEALPSFMLVNDNSTINISHSVTQLDGSYIAEGSTATGGIINDCTIGGSVPGSNIWFNDIRDSNLANSCSQQLVVNGSLEANQINFDRTYDSLYEAGNNDTNTQNENGGLSSYYTCGSAINQSCSSSSASEVINYSALEWLTLNNTGLSNKQQNPIIQSITSLSPIIR